MSEPVDVSRPRPTALVIGGGISGLTAAFELSCRGLSVTVLEASKRLGGKLRAGEVAGVSTDLGAEAILARRPEALALAAALGIDGELVEPATTTAGVWSRGRLRPFPQGHVMGVPRSLRSLRASGVVSPAGVARATLDLVLPPTGTADDVSVAAALRPRLGREVVARLVEPLLGGVYAGRADRLSLPATAPQLAAALEHGSVMRSLRRLPTASGQGPVFVGFPGGVARLADALVRRLSADGVRLRTSATVRAVRRAAQGWRCEVGPASAPEIVDGDLVVVAVPAPAAARMLDREFPRLAADLSRIEYASVAVVTAVFDAEAVNLPSGSGFLVPAVEKRLIKAVTFSSNKWPWYAERAPGRVVVRASIGRFGDTADLQRDDDELADRALAELAALVGIRAHPLGVDVTRWGGALPQYDVGHLARVARIRSETARARGMALCGAALDGVGIPACIAGARAAVAGLLDTYEPVSRAPGGE
ncbi:MAG: protoporphyrinogen oxidase [Acidothermus sp.]|nr:protoporphyrinogen oxidase [Acidothermus sp.]MCL6537127.1 protoporphyrinogen oxidase [Acidothermus sp.]